MRVEDDIEVTLMLLISQERVFVSFYESQQSFNLHCLPALIQIF